MLEGHVKKTQGQKNKFEHARQKEVKWKYTWKKQTYH